MVYDARPPASFYLPYMSKQLWDSDNSSYHIPQQYKTPAACPSRAHSRHSWANILPSQYDYTSLSQSPDEIPHRQNSHDRKAASPNYTPLTSYDPSCYTYYSDRPLNVNTKSRRTVWGSVTTPVTLKATTSEVGKRRSVGTKHRRLCRKAMGMVQNITSALARGNTVRLLSWVSLSKIAVALPIDPGEAANTGWPNGPGLPSISGWPSPLFGMIFAVATAYLSRPHDRSRIPGAMALVTNYLSLVVSGDAASPAAVTWT